MRGRDAGRRGRNLDPGPDAGAVQPRAGPPAQLVHKPRRRLLDPDGVRRRRIAGRLAELVEVAAGAEGRPLASQLHRGAVRIDQGELQRLDQFVAHARVHGVARFRPGKGHDQQVAFARQPHARAR